MASITIKLTATCSGGNHLTYTVTGAKAATVRGDLAETQDAVTDEEAIAFAKVISKLAKSGRTLAQAKTLLQSGVTVTV